METVSLNTPEIQITALGFRNSPADKHRLESYPRRMVLDGREYTFIDSGMRYLIKKGQQLIKLFDVSDGSTMYRLRLEGESRWTLVTMRAL